MVLGRVELPDYGVPSVRNCEDRQVFAIDTKTARVSPCGRGAILQHTIAHGDEENDDIL